MVDGDGSTEPSADDSRLNSWLQLLSMECQSTWRLTLELSAQPSQQLYLKTS